MAAKPIRKVKSYPNGNPKEAMGATKIPLHLVPPSATHYIALALADGAAKYGPYNWREAGITLSTYKSASDRHWSKLWDGEDLDQESLVHHAAHAMACAAIFLDALSIGKVIDDRPPPGASAAIQAQFIEALKAKRDAAAKAAKRKARARARN